MKKIKLFYFVVSACMLLGFTGAQAQCPYVPLYSSGNLVSDPECNSLTAYASWGSQALISGANAYCGTSVGVTGGCGGSLDYNLNSVSSLNANTTYRLRAMVYTNGTASFTLHGCGINGSTDEYHYDINTGSTWQAVDFLFTTGTLATTGGQWFYFNSCGAYNATDIRLDNFEIYAYTAPVVSASTSFIGFEGTTSASFTVTGTNQTDAVTLTAPAGITLSTYSIPANPFAVSVTATYDGTTSISDTIRLTSGSAKAKIAVNSYSTACFTQLAPKGTNMVPDPYLNSISGFGGWGYKAVVTGDEAYCGRSSVKFTAVTNSWPDGAALDVSNITWAANQKYRFRAMVYTIDGSLTFKAKNTDPDYIFDVPQSTGWVQIDSTFTTGANPTSGGFFTFNNVDGTATGKIAYIDNYELWPVSTATAVKTTSALSKPSICIKGNAIVADFELAQSSNVEISIFNAQGLLLSKTSGFYNAGKNSKVLGVNLASGLYLVRINQNGQSITSKVIK